MDAELVNAQIGVPGPYRIRLCRHVDESLLYQVHGPGLVDEGWTSLMHRAVCAARQYNNVWNAARATRSRAVASASAKSADSLSRTTTN